MVNVPFKTAGPQQVAAVMGELEAAQAAGEKVVVHCWGGGGRAGGWLEVVGGG